MLCPGLKFLCSLLDKLLRMVGSRSRQVDFPAREEQRL